MDEHEEWCDGDECSCDDIRKMVVFMMLDNDDSGASMWKNDHLADTVTELIMNREKK